MPVDIEVVDDPGRVCAAMLVGVAAGGGHVVLTMLLDRVAAMKLGDGLSEAV
jgi:hypothetical protein